MTVTWFIAVWISLDSNAIELRGVTATGEWKDFKVYVIVQCSGKAMRGTSLNASPVYSTAA